MSRWPGQSVTGLLGTIVFTWDNFNKTPIRELKKRKFFCFASARSLLPLRWPTHLWKKFLPRFRLVRADWSFVAASPREQRLFGHAQCARALPHALHRVFVHELPDKRDGAARVPR